MVESGFNLPIVCLSRDSDFGEHSLRPERLHFWKTLSGYSEADRVWEPKSTPARCPAPWSPANIWPPAKRSSQLEGVPRRIWRKPAPSACAERGPNKGGLRTPAPGTAVGVCSPPVSAAHSANGLALSPPLPVQARTSGMSGHIGVPDRQKPLPSWSL